MTDIVNLNKYRKKRKKDDRENEAVENRAKFGRTKGERTRDETEKKKRRREALDGKLIENGPKPKEPPEAG